MRPRASKSLSASSATTAVMMTWRRGRSISWTTWRMTSSWLRLAVTIRALEVGDGLTMVRLVLLSLASVLELSTSWMAWWAKSDCRCCSCRTSVTRSGDSSMAWLLMRRVEGELEKWKPAASTAFSSSCSSSLGPP
ncbi:hypothetical protein D3C85_1494670 [compost metagenome]